MRSWSSSRSRPRGRARALSGIGDPQCVQYAAGSVERWQVGQRICPGLGPITAHCARRGAAVHARDAPQRLPLAIMNDAEIEAAAALRPLVLALDFGTSSTRIQLHDARGRPISGTLLQRHTTWKTDASGGAWTDAAVLLGTLDALLDDLVARHTALLSDVVAGGASCLFHTFCGVDARHIPVTPLRSWADTSAAAAAAGLARRLDAEETRQRTGAPLHPGYWPARIAAARAERATAIAGWAGLPELVHHRLTGTWCLGRSLASGTGLWDRHQDRWDAELCSAVGVDADALAPVTTDFALVPAGEEAAARWPALSHLRWLAPIGDGACNNIGLGATGPGRAVLMIGTSAAMRLVLDRGAGLVAPGLFAYGIEGGRTLLGGALSEGGGIAAWWSRVTGRRLEDPPAGAGEAVMLPYLSGERAPGYHATATGTVAGLHGTDGADALLAAIMNAVALGLADVDLALGSPPSITATGGALRASPVWQRLVAAALGRPIDVARIVEPSLRGAALLALEAAGARPLGTVEPLEVDRVEPDEAMRQALRRSARSRAALYRRLVARDP